MSFSIRSDGLISKADIISTVEFDHTGDYLATGDKGGRVVLFERNEQVSSWLQSQKYPTDDNADIVRNADASINSTQRYAVECLA